MQNISGGFVNAQVPINENFANVLWAEAFARNPATTTGTTWGYVGGQWPINGVLTTIAAGTVTVANGTNYIGLSQAGAPVATLTTPNPLHAPLYTVVVAAGIITGYTDTRSAAMLSRHAHGIGTQAMADANQTITQTLALCDTLVTTGALTATRNLVVPLIRRRWAVRNTCTGGSIQVIGASGAGVTIATVKTAIVECDGANVNRITTDA